MGTLSHRTAHATLWSATEIAARYGVQIIVTIVLARLLAPSDFGLIAMLLVFTNIGAVLTDAGFGTALIQKQQTSADDESTVFWFNLATGVFAVALMWLGSNSIAAFFHQPALSDLTRAISWVLLFGALGTVPDALLTQKLEFRARARAQVVSSVTSGGIAIAVALAGYGVWSLIIQALAASGVRSACLWVFSHWHPRARFSTSSFRRLFGFGGFMLLSGLLNTVSVRLQSLLIGRLFDAEALGYYSLAQNATQAPTSFIGTMLSRVGLPVFANIADDRLRLRNALRSSLDVSMFVFVPCMVGLALAARPLIEEVYGARWGVAAPIASLLALAGALWPIHVLNLTALSAQGHSHRFFYLEVFKNLVIVVATLATARFGTIVVAGGMLAAGFCNAAVNTWYSHRLLGYGALAQLRDQRWTFLLSALSALPAWAMLHWTKESLLSVLLAILAAAIVYVGMAMVLRLPAWLQVVSVCKNIFHPESLSEMPNE
jgi:O-antigen/teichoic acid export membrane protein